MIITCYESKYIIWIDFKIRLAFVDQEKADRANQESGEVVDERQTFSLLSLPLLSIPFYNSWLIWGMN